LGRCAAKDSITFEEPLGNTTRSTSFDAAVSFTKIYSAKEFKLWLVSDCLSTMRLFSCF
jgi:hypothetical protein